MKTTNWTIKQKSNWRSYFVFTNFRTKVTSTDGHMLLLMRILSIPWWDISLYSFHHHSPMFLHCPRSQTQNPVQELFSSNWLLKFIHIPEKSVFETSSVANLETNTDFFHNFAFSAEEITASSLSPGDFNMIVHASALATNRFGMCGQKVRQVSFTEWGEKQNFIHLHNFGSEEKFSSLKLFV